MLIAHSDTDTDTDTVHAFNRPRVGPQRLLIALLQGALLYWLYRSSIDKLWPASVPTLFVPLVLVAMLCPVLLIVSLGHLAPRRIALWVGGAVLLVAALGVHDGWRRVFEAGSAAAPSPLLFVHLVAGLFIAHTLVAVAGAHGRKIGPYPAYFDAAWKLAVQLVFSAGFVGAAWLVLNLGGELFKLIKLDFLAQLLKKSWFNIPVIVFAFACAVHITDVRPAIVRGIRGLMLVLMAWLLPVVTILVGGFLCSLPFTGLAPLWATRHAAATLLGAAALLVVMINAAWQNGAALPAVAAPLRWSARLAAILLCPLVAIAAWALSLRVADYGWTDERIVACACIVVAACYALGYLAAALQSARLERIASVNIATAFVVLLAILALFSPLADPARVSVDSQLARLKSGKVAADKFDYFYLRSHGERYGREALAALGAQAAGPQAAVVKAGVARAQAAQHPFEERQSRRLTPDRMRAKLTMWPAGTALPAGFPDRMHAEQSMDGVPACLIMVGPGCDVFAVDLSGTGKPDLLVMGQGSGGSSAVFHQHDDGVWRLVESLSNEVAGCPWLRAQLIAGNFRAVTPPRKVLEVGGQVLAPVWSPNSTLKCPSGG